ncbi:MAG: hypothetical protein HY854_21690 [Burkholderiales bacterium]|nr:hypothetical protein [Burkholderiales bacterium]
MLRTLIDNATVSSVQRALGKAQLKDPGTLDIEHAALERLAEAVLLTEEVVVPDNYKEEFTPARKELLSRFNVRFLPVDEPVETSLNEVANELTGIWTDAFAEGSSRSLFSQYFEQVEAFSTFIWEHSSSEFFLVFRAHGVGKESPLIEALLASPKNDELGKRLRIVAGDGHSVEWAKLSRHVQRMLAVMGWLGHQYVWHQVLAARHDLVYSPHPLREFFAHDFLSRVGRSAHSASNFENVFRQGITRFEGRLQDGLRNLGAYETSVQLVAPALLPLILKESDNSDDFIRVLGELRNEPKIAEMRETLSAIYVESERGDFRRRTQFIADVEKIGEALLLERGIERHLLRIKPPTMITGIAVEGDDTGVKLPIPSRLYKQFFFKRKYRAILRNVMADLAVPSKLGALKTKLNSWAWLGNSEYGSQFFLKPYRFPSKFHRPLNHHHED